MFSENKKERKKTTFTSGQNILATGTKITGNLSSEGDIRIDGELEGDLNAKGKVVVGKTGVIIGNLYGTDAYFEGKHHGNMQLTGSLTLKSSANINGEITIAKLEVEPGAVFNVSCTMKDAVKQINNHEPRTKQPEQTEKYA